MKQKLIKTLYHFTIKLKFFMDRIQIVIILFYLLQGFTKEFTTLTALITHHSVMPELLPCPLSLSRYNPSFVKSDSNKDFADIDSDPDYNTLADFRKMMADLNVQNKALVITTIWKKSILSPILRTGQLKLNSFLRHYEKLKNVLHDRILQKIVRRSS